MRSVVVLALAMLAVGSAASAQSADKGYAEGFIQSAFGNVTSQAYGGEAGFTVRPNLQVFVEAGAVRDVATASIGTAAQQIAGFLSQTQPNVGFQVKQPVAFGVGGVKLTFPTTGKLKPYVLAGGGVANVKQDVTFSINGSDVTGSLATYGVQLGSDLSGSFTKPMFTAGVGAMWPAWQRLVIDVQYRYGRIFAEDEGINVSRAGIGLGFRF